MPINPAQTESRKPKFSTSRLGFRDGSVRCALICLQLGKKYDFRFTQWHGECIRDHAISGLRLYPFDWQRIRCDVLGDCPCSSADGPGDEERSPRHSSRGSGQDRRSPDEQRKQAYHSRFHPRGRTRKNGKQHAKTASDMPSSGQVGPEHSIREPRWHQVSSRLYIHDMGQPNRYECNGKEDPCDAKAALPRGEGQG